MGLDVFVSDYGWVFGLIVLLLLASAFFSGSETAMNSCNRYRLAYQARNGNRWAILAVRLLHRPERMLSIILVGNNIVNIFVTALVTLLAAGIWGQSAVPIAGAILTLVILIFAEVVPKSIAAHRPEAIVRFVVTPLRWASVLLWPLVVVVNQIAGLLLKPFRLLSGEQNLALNEKELRVLLETAGTVIPEDNLHTMLRVLDLSQLKVSDAMVPHTEIDGLDLEDSMAEIFAKIHASNHSRLPVYRRSIDNVIGFLSMRTLSQYIGSGKTIDKATLENNLYAPVFVPETTPLHVQLQKFRQERGTTMALVVDEYGGVQGLLTIWDLVAEILGNASDNEKKSRWQLLQDGSIIVEAVTHSREINRALGWDLPDHEEARTLNGLIVEKLEAIPHGNVCLELGEYRMETLRIEEQAVRTVRIWKHSDGEQSDRKRRGEKASVAG